MEHRDLIMDQIEQLGKVLTKILSNLLGHKSSGQLLHGIEISNKQLNSELNIDAKELLKLNREALEIYLVDRSLGIQHIETLSRYLEEVGKGRIGENKEEGLSYLNQALVLIELLEERSNTISFEGINRKLRITELLNGH